MNDNERKYNAGQWTVGQYIFEKSHAYRARTVRDKLLKTYCPTVHCPERRRYYPPLRGG